MNRIGKGLFVLCFVSTITLSANSSKAEDAETADAINQIQTVSKQVNEQKQKQQVRQKTPEQKEMEEEKNATKADIRKSLDLMIWGLKKLQKRVDRTYDLVDVEIVTIGKTKIYVNANEFKTGVDYLRGKKELLLEISNLLSVLNSSKSVESDSVTRKQYIKVLTKYESFQKNMSKQPIMPNINMHNSDKRIVISEGVVAEGIIAKRHGNRIVLKIKI